MTTDQKPEQKPVQKPTDKPVQKKDPQKAIHKPNEQLQNATRWLSGPDRPPRGTRPNAPRYRTIQEWLIAKRWMLVRLAVAVVVLLAAAMWARPLAMDLVEEQYSAGAVRKARVLLRGAQIVATQQLVDFASWEDTEQHLLQPTALPEIVTAGRFEVEPVEITAATLNERGEIDSFDCELLYENRRYRIRLDVAANTATPELLEKLPPQKTDE